MSSGKAHFELWIDPRTKIMLLLLCVLSASMAPSLFYEILLVGLVALFGLFSGKFRVKSSRYLSRDLLAAFV